jgi:hypothetical protein
MSGGVEQLVPAVTELVIAELLYLQWLDPRQPTYVYINSTGTSRADGETVLSHDLLQLNLSHRVWRFLLCPRAGESSVHCIVCNLLFVMHKPNIIIELFACYGY